MLLGVLVAAVVAGCGGASDSNEDGASGGNADASTTLTLVAYSTPQVVYDEATPAFAKTAEGKGVGFKTSYGGSGDQSRAVEAGLKADVVAFSLAPDVDRLVDAGLVASDWASAQHDGMVSDSVVVLATRKGNPKGIKTWDDLLKPGVQVVTPNPFSSGGAKWNLMAAYGAKSEVDKNPDAGLAFLRELISEHVKVQDKSAREALQSFLGGQGDVLIAYENEAITAQQEGEDVDYVVPDDTILIENPVAVTKDAAPQAKAFLEYLWSPAGQQTFADHGYRPVDEDLLKTVQDSGKFPTPPGLFTIADLGGWDAVNDAFFDVEHGSVAKIEEDAGVSTAK